MNNNLFFSLYRNSYIRNSIHRYIWNDGLKITISLEYFIRDLESVLHLTQFCDLDLFVTTQEFNLYSKEFILSPEKNKFGIRSIEFDYYFNQYIPPGFIPENVHSVKMGFQFNQPIEIGTFPSGVKSIIFSYYFNQPLYHCIEGSGSSGGDQGYSYLTPNLTKLYLNNKFDQHCPPSSLPRSLKKLTIGSFFSGDIGYLDQLVSLKLPSKLVFNKVVTIPQSVTSLKITNDFYEPKIQDTLAFLSSIYPRNLKKLMMYLEHSHNLYFKEDSFPSTLTKLDLRSRNLFDYLVMNYDEYDDGIYISNSGERQYMKQFDFPYSGVLQSIILSYRGEIKSFKIPFGVKNLCLLDSYKPLEFKPGFIPHSVSTLVLDRLTPTMDLPPSVTYLQYFLEGESSFNDNWDLSNIRKLKILSDSSGDIEQPLLPVKYISLPKVTPLNMGYLNKMVSVGTIPNTVTRLHISWCNDFNLSASIPTSVTWLKLWSDPSIQLSPGVIPQNIKKLKFENIGPIEPGALPSSLTYLSLGIGYQSPIKPKTLPPSLTILKNINNVIYDDQWILPDSLVKLEIPYRSYHEFITLKTLVKNTESNLENIICTIE